MAEREKPVGQMALAKLCGNVEPRTIRNWVKEGMPERSKDGRPQYMLSEVIPWLRQRDQRESKGKETLDEQRERTLKIRAERRLAQAKLKEQLGQLIPAADVERAWERACAAMRGRITGARGKWAPSFVGLKGIAEVAPVLDAMAVDILAALLESADELDEDDDEEAAA